MEKTPITKLSEAAESGIITTSPALWEEWKRTMEESFRIDFINAFEVGRNAAFAGSSGTGIYYYEQRFGKLNQ